MPQLISDTTLQAALCRSLDCPPPATGDEYRACLRSSAPPLLVVFRNGTQIGEFDSVTTSTLVATFPALLAGQASSEQKGDTATPAVKVRGARARRLWGEESFIATLRDTTIARAAKLGKIVDLGSWPNGLTISDHFDIANSRVTIYRQSLHITGLAQIFFAYIGAGYHSSWYYGSLQHALLKDSLNNYRNQSFSWTVGVPFFRYEMAMAGQILPEYVWLEEDIVAVLADSIPGKTIRRAELRWDARHKANWCHLLKLRLGHASFDMLFDREIYRRPITRLAVDKMPAVFGTWGASLTRAADVWIPGAAIEFPGIAKEIAAFGAYQIPLTIEPMRIQFYYWNFKRLKVDFSIALTIGYRKKS
jgi:hypothetical protein